MDLLARTQGPEEAVYTPEDCKKVKFNLKILKYATKKFNFFLVLKYQRKNCKKGKSKFQSSKISKKYSRNTYLQKD